MWLAIQLKASVVFPVEASPYMREISPKRKPPSRRLSIASLLVDRQRPEAELSLYPLYSIMVGLKGDLICLRYKYIQNFFRIGPNCTFIIAEVFSHGGFDYRSKSGTGIAIFADL
jgi:hypothetical protein